MNHLPHFYKNIEFNSRKGLYFCAGLLFLGINALGQSNPPSDSLHIPKNDGASGTVKQIDIWDVARMLFGVKFGSRPDTEKLRPGKLMFSMVPAIGYTLEAGLDGSVTANLSFFTADPNTTYMSTIATIAQYSIRNQFVAPIMSRIWLKDNKIKLVGDWRFYSYPSKTYGLGDNTSFNSVDNVNYYYVQIHEIGYYHFLSHYYIGGGYYYDNHWDLRDYTYPSETDFLLYDNNLNSTISSGPVVTVMYDNRANANNPQGGFYGSLLYRYNTTLLGSISNWQYFEAEFRKYFKLNPNLILAFWNRDLITWGGYVPYFDLPANGFGTEHFTGRGYIQSRFRGTDQFYGESELRFGITRNGLLGGVVFTNAETVPNWPNNTFTAIFPAGGAGLRIKFNKFSDVNICIDYAVGIGGSHGFFFNLGEVF